MPREPGVGRHVRGGVRAACARPFFSSASHAFTTAEPHDAVPIDPPASEAARQRAVAQLDPDPGRRRAAGPRAAIWVSAVRAPVPMSAAAIRTTKPPSSAVAVARDGRRRAG